MVEGIFTFDENGPSVLLIATQVLIALQFNIIYRTTVFFFNFASEPLEIYMIAGPELFLRRFPISDRADSEAGIRDDIQLTNWAGRMVGVTRMGRAGQKRPHGRIRPRQQDNHYGPA